MIYISCWFTNQQQLRKKWLMDRLYCRRTQALAILASLARNNKKWVQTKLIIQAFDHFFTGLLCYCCWARNYAQIFFCPKKREAAKVSVFHPLSTKQTMDNDAMDTNHSSLLAWISSIYFVFCLGNCYIFHGLFHVYFLAKATIAKVLEFIFQFIVRTKIGH